MPIMAAAVVVLLLFPRLIHQRPGSAASALTKTNGTALAAKRTKAHPDSAQTATPASAPSSALVSSQPDAIAAETVSAKTPEAEAMQGEVLDQVLPAVSQKARDTIRGTVRVSVRMHIDALGEVKSAELEGSASSKFFADKAILAAKSWQFAAPKVAGHRVESEWVVRFEFTSNATHAQPTQVSPQVS